MPRCLPISSTLHANKIVSFTRLLRGGAAYEVQAPREGRTGKAALPALPHPLTSRKAFLHGKQQDGDQQSQKSHFGSTLGSL